MGQYLGQHSHTGLDAQLNGPHQLIGLDLLVGHLALLIDPPVPNLSVSITVGIALCMSLPPVIASIL